MNKTKKFVLIMVCLVVLCACSFLLWFFSFEATTIQELEEKSDVCVEVSTRTEKTKVILVEDMTDPIWDNWPPNVKTIKKNGDYYIEVSLDIRNHREINEYNITIIQDKKAYLEEEKDYLFFLKKSNTEENCYTIVDEPSGIIEIDKYEVLRPFNPRLKKEITEKIGDRGDIYEYEKSYKLRKAEN